MAAGGDADAAVRRVDQDCINEFGRLNLRKHELRDDLVELSKKIDELGDAEEGVMMADESVPGAVKLMIGEMFVDIDGTAATDYIQGELTKATASKASMEASIKQIEARQAELKALLYGRFGRSINLEES